MKRVLPITNCIVRFSTDTSGRKIKEFKSNNYTYERQKRCVESLLEVQDALKRDRAAVAELLNDEELDQGEIKINNETGEVGGPVGPEPTRMYLAPHGFASLKGMFPFIDSQVIIDVMEANNGNIEATIDCLLDIDYPKPEPEVQLLSTSSRMSDYELALIIQQQLYNESIPKDTEVSQLINQIHNSAQEGADTPAQLSYISEVLGSLGQNAKSKLLQFFQTPATESKSNPASELVTQTEGYPASAEVVASIPSEEIILQTQNPDQTKNPFKFETKSFIRRRKPCKGDPYQDC